MLLPLFLSTKTNRDCITRSCKPCLLSVRQVTLASPVAAAISCHAFHCLETASTNSSFSRPFKPCHCFSLDPAAFAGIASCNNSDTLTRALFDFDSTPSSGSTEGGGRRTRNISRLLGDKIRFFHLCLVFTVIVFVRNWRFRESRSPSSFIGELTSSFKFSRSRHRGWRLGFMKFTGFFFHRTE